MIRHFESFFESAQNNKLRPHIEQIREAIDHKLTTRKHGSWMGWESTLETLPPYSPERFINLNLMQIGSNNELSEDAQRELKDSLKEFCPWRKGPFSFFGIDIDTEWRSDWKWDRIHKYLSPLNGRRILDVGCGSGYHCWRMYACGAKWVLGIDPTQLFYFQYLIAKRWIGPAPVHFLPVGIEDIPMHTQAFDTVFSMGVLYHRRSPLDHLEQLRSQLRKGGELVLETLIVDGPINHALLPPHRYAMMNNVWFIPSIPTLEAWLKKIGFHKIRCVDVNKTSTQEQRTTDWMPYNSLSDFLDPTSRDKTIEGHPAPTRATFIAERL